MRAVERLVDGLGGNTATMACAEFVDDLLGTPPLVEIALHELTKLAVTLQQSALGTWPASAHHCLSGVRSIRAVDGSVALQFTTDRRHGTPELGRDRARRLPSVRPVGGLHPFGLGQVAARLDRSRMLVDDRLDPTSDPLARDRAAVLPPVTGLAFDAKATARLGVRHPLADQPHVLLALLRHRLPPGTTLGIRSHATLPTSGVATIAGTRHHRNSPGVEWGSELGVSICQAGRVASWSRSSLAATGPSQHGQRPPYPTRVMKVLQSSQRCWPRPGGHRWRIRRR